MSESGSERRQWPRIPASELSHITASVVAGPAVKLVNLSRGGALMEVASRLPMRSRVRLKLTLDTGAVTVAEGLVAWAKVAAIVDKQVNYLVAIVFDNAIPDLGGLDGSPVVQGSHAAPQQAEAPPEIVAAPPRGNLTHFPTPTLRVPEAPPVMDDWDEADEQVVSLDAVATGEAIGQAADHVAALTAANEALAAQVAAADAERNALREALDTERQVLEEERARLAQEIAAAAANVGALQATLAAREQEHAQALAAQQLQLEAGQSGILAREQEHAAVVAQLAEQQARYEALQSSFAAREHERVRALAELTEQQGRYEALQSALAAREQDHVRAVADLAGQQERYEGLQSTVATRDQEHAVALAEQKNGYEALTGELLQANHDQLAAYQLLLDERTAAREQDRLKSEAHSLELARIQEEAMQEREQLELRYLEVHARLEAAESVCAAHEARDRNLRREVEKLMALIAAPVRPAAADADGTRQAVA